MAESDELDRIIESKQAVIEALQSELETANTAKLRNEEEQKRQLYAEIEAKRVVYKPITTD